MTTSHDDQAFGILDWMMQQFSGSFPPGKIAQFEQLFNTAKQVEAAPWLTDADYADPVIEQLAQRLHDIDRPMAGDFAVLCGYVVAGKINVKQLFLILLQYAGDFPGEMTIQSRTDSALHFICGGAIEATVGLGQAAGALKEWTDSFDGGDCDPNDYAATLCGAKWVQHAAADSAWVATWAKSARTLTANLPALTFTATKAEIDAGVFDPATIAVITEAIDEALTA